MPAVTEILAGPVEIRRTRGRTLGLGIEGGRLVARVPSGISRRQLEPMIEELRDQLRDRLRRQRVLDDEALDRRARKVVRRFLHDQALPPFEVSFSPRQKKRWGSCTVDRNGGHIRISAQLCGHPNWVLDHLLLHELAHLVAADHGEIFRGLVERSPDHERGRGYLEALESLDLLGRSLGSVLERAPSVESPLSELPLFAAHPPAPGVESRRA